MTATRSVRQLATLAFLAYLVISAVLIGHGTYAHFGSTAVGYGPDLSLFVWDLKWWPQSILDGLDPLHIAVAYAPEGFDTALVASMPAPSVALAPLTQLVGPLASYNVLAILIPAVNGWAAYLLCREAGAEHWPSVCGGYVYGFSTYVLGHSLGHPHLSLVAMAPLAAYLVLRHRRQAISARRFTLAMTAVLTFQFLTSTEVLLTMAMLGAAAFGCAFALFPKSRAGLLDSALLTIVALAATCLLVSPYLISALTASQDLSHINPVYYSTDPLNLIVPTRITIGGGELARIGDRFTGNLAENGAYFGIPLLLALVAFAWQRRRDRVAMLLVGVFAISVLAAFGPRLNVLGSATPIRLPWTLFLHLPIVEYVLPERIVVFAWLALALVVALWLSTRGRMRWAKWALVGIGLIGLLPDFGATDQGPAYSGTSIWASPRPVPAFFESGNKPFFNGRPNLLVLPYNDAGNADNLHWQAHTGMAYGMPGGYFSGTIPDNFACWPITGRLQVEDYRRADRAELLAFLAAKQVDGVVAPIAEARAAAPLLRVLPGPARQVEGVVVYKVPPTHRIATCPRPSSSG